MKKNLILIFLVITTIFLGRELLLFQNSNFQIFAEKDYLLIRSETGKIWGYGNIDSVSAKNLSQNITSYFSREKTRDIFNLEENKEYWDKNMKLQKISRDLVYINFSDKSFLLFGENFRDKDREKIINSDISLQANWHILNKNIDLSFFSKPKKGIMYISERSPSQKLQSKSHEKTIPLISTKETGGFSLKLIDDYFNLLVRN